MALRILIETIPHAKQRYPTVGDWQWQADGSLVIRVSELSNWRREALIAVHELVEVLQCKNDGVTEQQVDAFDIEFEKNRAADDDSEAGDDPSAPYYRQHCLATGVERTLAYALGVTWQDYENELSELP